MEAEMRVPRATTRASSLVPGAVAREQQNHRAGSSKNRVVIAAGARTGGVYAAPRLRFWGWSSGYFLSIMSRDYHQHTPELPMPKHIPQQLLEAFVGLTAEKGVFDWSHMRCLDNMTAQIDAPSLAAFMEVFRSTRVAKNVPSLITNLIRLIGELA